MLAARHPFPSEGASKKRLVRVVIDHYRTHILGRSLIKDVLSRTERDSFRRVIKGKV